MTFTSRLNLPARRTAALVILLTLAGCGASTGAGLTATAPAARGMAADGLLHTTPKVHVLPDWVPGDFDGLKQAVTTAAHKWDAAAWLGDGVVDFRYGAYVPDTKTAAEGPRLPTYLFGYTAGLSHLQASVRPGAGGKGWKVAYRQEAALGTWLKMGRFEQRQIAATTALKIAREQGGLTIADPMMVLFRRTFTASPVYAFMIPGTRTPEGGEAPRPVVVDAYTGQVVKAPDADREAATAGGHALADAAAK